jgi:hypothetical protein
LAGVVPDDQIKALSIDCEIETFEAAFMAHVVMPNGATVGEQMIPQIAARYKDGGNMPFMLSGPSARQN